jgi:cytochrome P450
VPEQAEQVEEPEQAEEPQQAEQAEQAAQPDRGEQAERERAGRHPLLERAARLDPFPVYDAVREAGPCEVAPGRWLVARHDDVRAVLADPAAFSSDLRDPTNPVLARSPLIFDDPPRHTALRKLLARAFTGSRIAALEPDLRSLATSLLAAWDDGRAADFVAGYADPFPVRAIAVLLGVPDTDHARFKQWSEDRAAVVYRGPGSPADNGAAALDAYIRRLVAERRRRPAADLLSALVAEGLSDDEVAGVGAVILSAGNLTTTRLLANLVHALAEDPARLDAVRGDAAALVEESLRLDSPVQLPARRATRDAAVGGVVIPAGAFVMVGIGAANRDGAAYERPAELLPDRGGPSHLAFGHGIHFCLGAALARLEASVTLDLLATRCSRVELAGPAVRTASIAHRGFDELPVRLIL